MIRVFGRVKQESRRLADVQHENINQAVVIDIAERNASSTSEWRFVDGGAFRNVAERAVLLIVKELHRLAIFQSACGRVHLRIDMTVCNEEVEPTRIIEVDKTSAPFYVGVAWLPRF